MKNLARVLAILIAGSIFLGLSARPNLSIISSAYADDSQFEPAKRVAPDLSPLVGSRVQPFSTGASNALRGLMYCGVALLFVLSVAKKLGAKKQKDTLDGIQIICRRQVSPKTSLLIAEVDGRRFLLSSSPDNIGLLSELERVQSFGSSLSDAALAADLELEDLRKTVHG